MWQKISQKSGWRNYNFTLGDLFLKKMTGAYDICLFLSFEKKLKKIIFAKKKFNGKTTDKLAGSIRYQR